MEGKIYEFLADGFDEIEALVPVDAFRRAGLSIETVSIASIHGFLLYRRYVNGFRKKGTDQHAAVPLSNHGCFHTGHRNCVYRF